MQGKGVGHPTAKDMFGVRSTVKKRLSSTVMRKVPAAVMP